MSSTVLQLTDNDFEAKVLQSDKPVLVDFWATWCNPCLMIAPIVSEIADEYEGKLVVGKIDVDENHAVSSKYNIRSIPTLLIFKDGEVQDSLVGALPKEVLKEAVEKYI